MFLPCSIEYFPPKKRKNKGPHLCRRFVGRLPDEKFLDGKLERCRSRTKLSFVLFIAIHY